MFWYFSSKTLIVVKPASQRINKHEELKSDPCCHRNTNFLAMTIKHDQSKGRIIFLPYLLSCKVKMFGARWIRNCLWAGTFLLHLKITSPTGVIECKLVFLLQITNWSLGAQMQRTSISVKASTFMYSSLPKQNKLSKMEIKFPPNIFFFSWRLMRLLCLSLLSKINLLKPKSD